MKIERRNLAGRVVVESRADGEPAAIRGVAAVFYDGSPETEYQLWSDCYERIAPGAFDRALKESDDCRALFNHDANFLLGRTKSKTLTLSVSPKGLEYSTSPADTSVYRDVVEHVSRGDVDGSSFSFSIESEQWDYDAARKCDVRTILSVRTLYDVGPVVYPAYEGTTAAARSAGGVEEARASWQAWQSSRKCPDNGIDSRKRLRNELELLTL